MTTSFSAKVPTVVAAYFQTHPSFPTDDHPIVVAEFYPARRECDMGVSRGWQRTSYKKRVSRAWIRKLKREGVTYVRLAAGSTEADFHVDEILKNESILVARRRSLT